MAASGVSAARKRPGTEPQQGPRKQQKVSGSLPTPASSGRPTAGKQAAGAVCAHESAAAVQQADGHRTADQSQEDHPQTEQATSLVEQAHIAQQALQEATAPNPAGALQLAQATRGAKAGHRHARQLQEAYAVFEAAREQRRQFRE